MTDPQAQVSIPAQDAIGPAFISTHPGRTPTDGSSYDPSAMVEQPALIRELNLAVAECDSFTTLIREVGKIVNETSDCLGLWGLEVNAAGEFGMPVTLLPVDPTAVESECLYASIEEPLHALISHARQTRQVAAMPLPNQPQVCLVVAPIPDQTQSERTPIRMLIGGCFSTREQTSLRLQWLAGFVADAIERWQQRQAIAKQITQSKSLKDAFAVIDALNRTESFAAAAKLFVNHLQRLTGASQVVLAMGKTPTRLQIEAISGVEQLDHSAESSRATLAACQQPLLYRKSVWWAAAERQREMRDVSHLALDNYCQSIQTNAAATTAVEGVRAISGCVAIPLMTSEAFPAESRSQETQRGSADPLQTSATGGKLKSTDDADTGATRPVASEASADEGKVHVFGAVLISLPADHADDATHRNYIEQLTAMLSQHLALTHRANRSLWQVAADRWRQFRSTQVFRVVMAISVIALSAMMIPMPYRIHCDCQLQPIQRRFIAAPYDGILESSRVESGDVVREGDLMATLEGRQLRIELAGLKADYEGARKRRDASLAKRDVAQSQIAGSEMKRHQASITILEQKLKNLEVRSAIDGIVVSGNLDKAQGAPVEMGQTLFEIAPLEQMVAEVAIPESEISYVRKGMNVAVKLDAFPFETWSGTIKLIHEHAEIIDHQPVFIADVQLDNPAHQLKPGMKGEAKIRSDWAPLGWSLFHRPWESVRYWTVW